MPSVGVPVTVADKALGSLLVAVWLPQVDACPKVCVMSCTLSSRAESWLTAVSWFVRVVSVVVRAVTGCELMAINLEIVPEISIPELNPVLAEIIPIVENLKSEGSLYSTSNVDRQPGPVSLICRNQ